MWMLMWALSVDFAGCQNAMEELPSPWELKHKILVRPYRICLR